MYVKYTDSQLIDKAIELQRLATMDYVNCYNELTGTEATERVFSNLFEELRMAQTVKELKLIRESNDN